MRRDLVITMPNDLVRPPARLAKYRRKSLFWKAPAGVVSYDIALGCRGMLRPAVAGQHQVRAAAVRDLRELQDLAPSGCPAAPPPRGQLALGQEGVGHRVAVRPEGLVAAV